MTKRLKIIVGLGNPMERYSGTRHNIGLTVVSRLKNKIRAKFRTFRSKTHVRYERGDLALIKPLTYMNLSGKAVKSAVKRLVPGNDAGLSEDMLVVVDDVNIPFGMVRFRRSGSDGGHNGLRSVIDELGTSGFGRLRIGIGQAPGRAPAAELERYVLERFDRRQMKSMNSLLEHAAEAIMHWYANGIDGAMNKYNGISLLPDE